MTKWFCLLFSGLLLLCVLCEPSVSITPPFSDPMRVNTADGNPYPVNRLISLLQARINALPYLLARYCKTGDVVLVRTVQENLSALDLYVNQMGQSIANDREKEVFAKLMAGSQNLKDLVGKNVKAIEEFRRAERFFQFRADRLVRWISVRAEDLPINNDAGDKNSQNSFSELIQDIRIQLMNAVFLNVISTSDSENQPRREKARELWETVVRKAESLAEVASTPEQKEIGAILQSSLSNVRNLARDLLVRRDELNQAWEHTYSMVESFEALFKPGEPEKTPQPEQK